MKQVVVVDYGSQYTHLIKARLRELGHDAKIVAPNSPAPALKSACGLILSGGPASVYEDGAPQLSKVLAHLIFEEEVPTLGICYGMQAIAQHAAKKYYPAVESRKVDGKEVGEYGKTPLEISRNIGVLRGLTKQEVVWMSHGDSVVRLPPDFQRLDPIKDRSRPQDYPSLVIQHISKPIFCLQFHPEVSHTRSGQKILKNFLEICGAEQNWDALKELERIKRRTKRQIGKRDVFAFISGGNDSSVLALFLRKIVPEKRLHFFYIRGLGPDEDLEKLRIIGGVHPVRSKTPEAFADARAHRTSNGVHIIDARRRIYRALKGVVDPEEKRQIVGNKIFLQIWQEEAKKLTQKLGCDPADLILAQGTIYPDIIESGGSRHADRIKSHHNTLLTTLLIGDIVEPFRNLFKPDVRKIGRILGVDERLITQHPSPGPGYAVRILCHAGGYPPDAMDPERSREGLQRSTSFGMEAEPELQKICKRAGYLSWVLPLKSKGVQGDKGTYCYTASLVGPYRKEALTSLANTITNRFKGKLNRVVCLIAPHDTTSLQFMNPKKSYYSPETRRIVKTANEIFIRNLRMSNLYPLISQAFAVLVPLRFDTTDGYTLVLRAVETEDFMTASPFWLPWPLLERITNEIMRMIPKVQAIFYDITSKPPGTIEWE